MLFLAQSDITIPDLPSNAPWWAAVFAAAVLTLLRVLHLRENRKVEERAAQLKADLDDRARDSARQDNMLVMMRDVMALNSELMIKLNESVERSNKERDALLSVVTTNSAATHAAARQVEENTRVLLSVTDIIQAIKAQHDRAANPEEYKLSFDYLVQALEALIRERIVQTGDNPAYNESIESLGLAVQVLNAENKKDEEKES